MCYPKPGPRCSGHALKSMRQSYDAFEAEPANSPRKFELYVDYRKKRNEFFATPAGQAWLNRQIVETGDPDGSLAMMQERGAQQRAEALRELKMADQGDVVGDHSPEEVADTGMHDNMDLEQARRIERARNKQMLDAERLMQTAEDRFEYAEATESRDLIMRRENLRLARQEFLEAYAAWTLAFDRVDALESKED